MKTLKDVDVTGKTVLVRVDFNVPLDDDLNITDDTRIRFVLPTLNYLMEQQAKVVIASHLGRPKGKPDPAFSLKPAASRLSELLGQPVVMADDCVGQAVSQQVGQMAPGDVLLLENLRFHPGESANDDAFAAQLGALADIYVNDAFAVSHRENASVAAITGHVPICVGGFLLVKELESFDKALKDPERPLAAVVGGAKVSSKLSALYNMLASVNIMLIGGAMANTFLKARGINVGTSKVEDDLIDEAKKIMATAEAKKVDLYLPVDVMAADRVDPAADCRPMKVGEIPDDLMALDIGPETIQRFTSALDRSATILWNGPMGIFEMEKFAAGTRAVANAMAASKAFTVVGGGDTVSAVHDAGVGDDISYISTGGGAFLMLMEGKTLPAVAALERCR